MIINATNTGFTFIKTNLATNGSTGGLLAPDIYNLTLLSGSLAFQDTTGGLLDGNYSGIGGTNYTASFPITVPPAANTVTVSIPDFARGPDGNSADSINLVINNPNPRGGGIPVTVNIPAGDSVTTATVTLQYSTSLLTINSAFPNASLSGASFTSSTSTDGSGHATTVLTFTNPTVLPTGNLVLGGLVAYVPATAPYRAKQLLQIGSVVNGGAIPSINDNSVQVVAFLGNVSGTGIYSSLDSGLLLNASSGADAGFTNFPALDPAIVGDLNGGGAVDPSDAVQLNLRNSVGSNPAFVPPYPGAPSNTQSGPDPSLSIPGLLSVSADGTVLVPVNIDDTKPVGSTGMQVAQLALRYDPSEFIVSPQDVQLGNVPASGADWQLQAVVDQATGEIGITLASRTPINAPVGGSLVMIALQEKSMAAPAATRVELVASAIVNSQVFTTAVDDAQGPFTLTPTPTNSGSVPGMKAIVVLAGADAVSPAPTDASVAEQQTSPSQPIAFDNKLLAGPDGSWTATNTASTEESLQESKTETTKEVIPEVTPAAVNSSVIIRADVTAMSAPTNTPVGLFDAGREQDVIQTQQIAAAATTSNPTLNERVNRETAILPSLISFTLGVQVESAFQSPLPTRDAPSGLPKTRDALGALLWDRVENGTDWLEVGGVALQCDSTAGTDLTDLDRFFSQPLTSDSFDSE